MSIPTEYQYLLPFAESKDYDATVFDYGDIDHFTITQVDDFGETHRVVISYDMLDAFLAADPQGTKCSQRHLS